MRVRYQGRSCDVVGHAYDVSVSGIYLETDRADAPGTEAQLCFMSYLAPDPLWARCRVARTGDQPMPGMAVELVDADDNVRRLLREYCRQFDGGPRVVMVDDDPALLRMAARFFEREQISFIGIDAPLQAQHHLSRFDPEVVILDVMMPKVSGITLARRLLDDPTTQKVPIIFYTAAGLEAIPDDLYHLPIIQKGDPWPVLMGEVRSVLSGQLSSMSVR